MTGEVPLNYVIKPDGKVYNRMEGYNETTIKDWIDTSIIERESNTVNK
ncbi:MAG: hypothetical protein PHX21_05275 [bacterium]|nr:hypothetical protein [bacterium]